MPTVAVDKADLWERLGQEYSNTQNLLYSAGLVLTSLYQPPKNLTSSVSISD